ncbi:MAG TPA: enoyl-CoA hydratase-related protein [Pseudogracilibacillus sp.]|nr:enoyl-CoA hydratase-related protein [Pseudogracilibacillus sp.]
MEKVKLTSENGVSIITLNRPESYNALDVETLHELSNHLETVKNNDDSVLILTGEGKAFSAGGDIQMMRKMTEIEQFNGLMDTVTDIAMELYLMPKMVISAVNGSAAGLGLSVALNADYIVANDQARFGVLFAGIGLIPDCGAHFFLEQRLGVHAAKQFMWSLEQVSGEEAKRYGFVDVMTDGDALEAAKHLAAKLSASPILALVESKLLLHGQKADLLRDTLEREKVGQLKMRGTKDHAEGVDAFLNKRKPNFIGE